MKIFWLSLLGMLCLNPVIQAQYSHYTNNRIDINFNGKNKKMIYTSHLQIYDDVDCEKYRYAKMEVPHNGNIEDALITVTPTNGKVKVFGKRDAYLESNSQEYILASDDKVFVWDLGKIAPGTRIDYRYEIKDDDAKGADYGSVLENLPVDSSVISIKFPSNKWKLKYSIDNSESILFDSIDQAIFIWSKLPARVKSLYKKAPRDYFPGLWYLFESKKGEEDISEWPDVYKWAEGRLGSDLSFADSAKMLAVGSTPEQILAAINERCHYVAVELGKGWYIPESSDDVWSKGYGDCKGLAMLFVNWMRAAGFKSWPVLVMADNSLWGNTDFPSPFLFNHMIAAYVTASNDTVYQDLTAEFCPLGYHPNSLYGCLAFPIRPNAVPFRLGVSDNKPDTTEIEIEGGLAEDGTLVGKIKTRITGGEARLKNWFGSRTRTMDRNHLAQLYLESLLPNVLFKDVRQDSTAVDLMSIAANINIRRFGFRQDSLMVFRPWNMNFLNEEFDRDTSRCWSTPLKRNMFYKVIYRVQSNALISDNQKGKSYDHTFDEFSYNISSQIENDSLITEFNLYFPPVILSPEVFSRYIAEKKSCERELSEASMFSFH